MLQGIGGVAALLLVAWLLSEDRRRISIRIVLSSVALQIVLALLLIKFPPATSALLLLNKAVDALQRLKHMTALLGGHLQQRGGPRVVGQIEPGVGVTRRALAVVVGRVRRQRGDGSVEFGQGGNESLPSLLGVHGVHRRPFVESVRLSLPTFAPSSSVAHAPGFGEIVSTPNRLSKSIH